MVGAERLVTREWIAPVVTPIPSLIRESGNLNPASGAWQLAHDCPTGWESVRSKKRSRPRRSFWVSRGAGGAGAGSGGGPNPARRHAPVATAAKTDIRAMRDT